MVLCGSAAWTLIQSTEKKLETARRKKLRMIQHLTDWVKAHRRSKWRFAGQAARTTDGRWTKKLLEWSPPKVHGRRAGKPCTRWCDDLNSFTGDWVEVAQDEVFWQSMEELYVNVQLKT